MQSIDKLSNPKAMTWTGRVLSTLVILLMLLSAVMKLTRSKEILDSFDHFGYASNLIIPLAITEMACAILYAIPRISPLGAILPTGYLGGATATNLRVGDPTFIVPAIVGVIAWLGLFLRIPALRRMIPLRR